MGKDYFEEQRWAVFLLLAFEIHISNAFEYFVICI